MDPKTFAPCGLICGLCKEANEGCNGCRQDDEDEKCHQLLCCRKKGLDGCWLCKEFPCNNGCFNNEKLKGLIIGFAKCIKEYGPEKFFAIARSKLGTNIDYQDYLSISEQNIVNFLKGNK